MDADLRNAQASGPEPTGPSADDPEIKLDSYAQSLIGHHLKAIYSEVVQEPVPDHLLKLLEELESKEGGS